MKTTFGSRRYPYLARIGIFLVTAAIIAGMAGCVDGGGAVSTAAAAEAEASNRGAAHFRQGSRACAIAPLRTSARRQGGRLMQLEWGGMHMVCRQVAGAGGGDQQLQE
jgi:hypothetical protein